MTVINNSLKPSVSSKTYYGTNLPIDGLGTNYSLGSTFVDTSSNTIYELAIQNSTYKWVKKVDYGIGIRTIHYDGGTFRNYIDEILTYVNSENGGTLLFIGFSLVQDVNGPLTILSTPAIAGQQSLVIERADTTFNLLPAENFTIVRPAGISRANELKLTTAEIGLVGGVATLTLSNAGGVLKANISGSGYVLTNDKIQHWISNDFSILDYPIDHLVIEYQISN